jgi:hypothetical protein
MSDTLPLRIAVLGAGNVGGTLGRRWAGLGHHVVFGVRRPDAGASSVKGGDALPATARVASPADAVRNADVVLLATPWAAVQSALADAGAEHGALDGCVLIDATNPIGPGLSLLTGADGASGSEQVQTLAPKARVVKAFNTTGYDNMREPSYAGAASVMFYAGDDAAAKAVVERLVRELGFEAVDAGPLVRARQLENLALLWISLAFGGLGRDIAFRLMRR